MYPKLLVISDTGMFRKGGDFYAFGPVARELEALDSFRDIVWIGFNRLDQLENKSFIKITDPKIHLKFLNRAGGKRLWDKLFILLNYPIYISQLVKEIRKAEIIHVRAPSNPAVITMYLSHFFPQKKFWFKYAGDWMGNAPAFYNFQRERLKKLGNNSRVTVNGKWAGQPQNIVAFENPCLDEKDREEGLRIVEKKTFSGPLNYCFVGGLNANKGCMVLLQTLSQMDIPPNFRVLHIVGEGHLKAELTALANELDVEVIFHDSLPKEEIVAVYKKCHFLVLPSRSEGFPKVIGEAMNYGCVPVVTDISSIGQYIENETNGILIETVSMGNIKKAIEKSVEISSINFRKMVEYNYKLAGRFTYKFYKERVIKEILK